MVKKEAHDKALDMYLKAGGKITIKAIAEAVGATPLTVRSWQKKDNWEAKLKEVKAAPAVRQRKSREGGVLKKDIFSDAVKIFQESGGTISNVELSKKVKVSPQTIANWKKMPEWNQVAAVPVTPEPVKEAAVPQALAGREVTTVDIEAIIAPQDLVALNERLRSMLNREYLTTEDLEHLSNAKLTLLEAADVYLGMLEDAGHEE
jgi:uncharacterized protein YjcR